ncbi:butyrophilin subfamily 2 member A1-like [Neoarius graeffei]|uniref:butyrophilin subfamily 2 member A1-like n=1 Tax=Neoarius graeffei TaxID=443677 RepID=UPI00298D57BD|nr:butyrophilin subfamily 2 member A1-like [Neoarius graeffei]
MSVSGTGDKDFISLNRLEEIKMAAASNEFILIGPSDNKGYNPSAVTLSCRLSPEVSAVNMEIRWFKGTDCVCVYKNRQETKGRGYEGRASLITQELEKGNVSLQLRDCTGSELRHYLCQVSDGHRTEAITLEMRASTWEDSGVDQQRREEAAILLFSLQGHGDRDWLNVEFDHSESVDYILVIQVDF